jgi:large subunit ribosomal protein L29
MKPSEMRELSSEELADKESELKDQLFKLRFQHALGQLENTMKLNTIKKDLARIKTIQNESGSGGSEERKKDK